MWQRWPPRLCRMVLRRSGSGKAYGLHHFPRSSPWLRRCDKRSLTLPRRVVPARWLAAEIVRRYRQGRTPYALVSASQDGAWLTAFFSLVGLRTVRGSSSRFGREAANELVEIMRAGRDIGITPDGPRGPRYEIKPGAIIVPRRTEIGRAHV